MLSSHEIMQTDEVIRNVDVFRRVLMVDLETEP